MPSGSKRRSVNHRVSTNRGRQWPSINDEEQRNEPERSENIFDHGDRSRSSFCRTATTPDAIYRCTSGRFPSRTRPWVYDCIPPLNETARAVAAAGWSEERRGRREAEACLKIAGFNPMRDRSFRDVCQAHQPTAAALDRRHDGAPVQRSDPEGLRSECKELHGLPRPVAGHGDERRSSPLSTAYGAAAGQPLVDQRRHRRAAVLFYRDARTARPRSPSEDRERAAQGPSRAEPGGGGASPRSSAGPQV